MRDLGAALLRTLRRPEALAACVGALCAIAVVLVTQSFSLVRGLSIESRRVEGAIGLEQQRFAFEIIDRSLTAGDPKDNLAHLAFYAKVGVLDRYKDNILAMATAAG